jgi:hypothetical protein
MLYALLGDLFYMLITPQFCKINKIYLDPVWLKNRYIMPPKESGYLSLHEVGMNARRENIASI